MRALVVGLGRMGTFHHRVLCGLGFALTTVDPDPQTGAQFATLADALADSRQSYDVAAIACPTEHLVETALQLCDTPMLIEKPCGTSAVEVAALGAYLHARGTPVCVGFVERFNPRVRELRARFADEGRVIRSARFVRHSDRPCADLALDLLTHDLDLVRYLGLGAGPWPTLEFDVRAGQAQKARRIELELRSSPSDGRGARSTLVVDLMDHDESPLHDLWFAFLAGRPVPTPADAAWAIRDALCRRPMAQPA